MKKIFCLSCIVLTMFLFRCYDPNIDREEEYMNIYIPMCQEKIPTLQNVPLVENTVNYIPLDLNTEKDTVLQVGLYCSGMVLSKKDISLKMALETDSLASLQGKGVSLSVCELLPESYYTVESWDVIIPKGRVSESLNVYLKCSEIPAGSNYILPLKIAQTSDYEIDKSASFLLLGISKK